MGGAVSCRRRARFVFVFNGRVPGQSLRHEGHHRCAGLFTFCFELMRLERFPALSHTHSHSHSHPCPFAPDKVFTHTPLTGWTGVSVVALGNTYRPPACDHTNGSGPRVHCVHAPAGFQADSFIYALSPLVYLTSFPIFLSDHRSSKRSTVHQSDVMHKHKQAFRIMYDQVRELYMTTDPLPVYVEKACEKVIVTPLT